MPIISAENLSKVYRTVRRDPGLAGALKALVAPRYEEKRALDRVSFTVEPGEVVGYIGVNGAGKSTTIKLLTGILRPSGGVVRVLGRDPFRERVANARDIGVVFGQRTQLWFELAVIESLDLIARIYDIEPARYRQLLDELDHTLGLGELLPVPVRNLSLGQRMRAELAATLIHEPRVVFLDEPTIGLDLVVKDRLRALIRQEHERRGLTVVLTTHDLGDIEELCSRVLIVDAGQLVYDGPLARIKERLGTHRVLTFEVAREVEAEAGRLSLPAGAEVVRAEGHALVVRLDRRQASASQVAAAVMNQLDVADLAVAEPDLATLVKQIYAGALTAGQAG
ncbi:MAG TPA: ATP-binding cassette domain-containing protein [Polyangia bacterium]|jgi:ABC-2 type transport system ATP-binding protein|nr:ATP-binding cassette domain-containing protein [Polyangia bacterium]